MHMRDRSVFFFMIYNYEICGIRIRCEIPYEVRITDESIQFLSDFDQPHVLVSFIPVGSIDLPNKDGTWIDDSCYYGSQDSLSVFHCPVRGKGPYAHVFWDDQSDENLICHYLAGYETYISSTKNIIDLIGIETLFLKFRACILHASYISYDGKAILFSAPSGTGKSTQADLWKKFRGADVINGDRAGLKCQNSVWYAWGLPFAGSSGIYRNECYPISALVFLRQASYNKVHRLTFSQALRLIFPEVTMHRWDERFVQHALDNIEKLLLEVPVYMLECLPNEDAVRVLEEEIAERRYSDGSGSC